MPIAEFETSLAGQAPVHAPREIADLFERIAAAKKG